MKHKIWMKISSEIIKDLVMSLINCKGTFELNTNRSEITIFDITGFTLDEINKSDAQFRIDIIIEGARKSILINKHNLPEFTVHFL